MASYLQGAMDPDRLLIETRNLQYAYPKASDHQVLDRIDLQLRRSGYVLLSGASGSGKSTLVRTFNGLIPHFYGGVLKGHVSVNGIPTADQSVSDLYQSVGMVFQNPEAQLFNRTVAREIAFGLESLGLERSEMQHRLEDAARRCGIMPLLDRNPHTLSGGQQHLVAIAAVIAARPQMIILDEPYANLDPRNVQRIRNVLLALHQEGTGILISEHRLAPTAPDVEQMLVLNQGRIQMNGAPRDLFAQDMEEYGLETPLAVKIGRQNHITPLPLDRDALQSKLPLNFELKSFDSVSATPATITNEVLLETDALAYTIDHKPVLQNINFKLHRGECLAIVGANGAGKTTLLKHMNGLCRPTSGCVRFKGHDIHQWKVSYLAQHVGVAFQNPNSQFFKLTVADEIQVAPRAMDRLDEAWLENLTTLFSLEKLMPQAPFRLSSGEKKRVAFAAALSAKPDILALDEPTAGQDLAFRRALRNLLYDLMANGRSVLLVTQDLSFAEQVAHTWLLLAEGRNIAYGPPEQVMADTGAMQQAGLEPTDAFALQRKASCTQCG